MHKDRATIYLNVYHNQKLFVLLQYCDESRKYDSEEHEPMNHHNTTLRVRSWERVIEKSYYYFNVADKSQWAPSSFFD